MSQETAIQKINAAFENNSDGSLPRLRVALNEAIAEIFTAINSGGAPSLDGSFKMQGDYDFTATNEFPTADDCADDLTVDDGIPKGYAWRVSVKFGDYSIGDIIVAKVDNAENTSEHWDVLEGNIGNSPNLIAEATDINGQAAAQYQVPYLAGKDATTHFITHMVIVKKTGTLEGNGNLLLNDDLVIEDFGLAVPGGASGSVVARNSTVNYTEGIIEYEVTVEAPSECVFDVKVYGYPY